MKPAGEVHSYGERRPFDEVVKVIPLADGSGLVQLALRVSNGAGWRIHTMPAFTATRLAFELHDAAMESLDYVPYVPEDVS